MARESWRSLGRRLEERLIVAIDLVSILLFDAVILMVGYGVIWIVEVNTNADDRFFGIAKAISNGTFLLLYVVWACWDLWSFARGQFAEQVRDEVTE